VVFDLGETLVDETRVWGEWADALGIPRLTFFAVLGSTIAAGDQPHTAVFPIFRPDLASNLTWIIQGLVVLFVGLNLTALFRRRKRAA